MTDWIMIAITTVYVVATILICVFNYRSAKATREQVAESKRQFDESNRPYISCEYILVKRLFHGIKFVNHGTKVAEKVKMSLNQKFIDSLTNEKLKQSIKKINEYEYTIGIGQSYDFFFATANDKNGKSFEPLQVEIEYADKSNGYTETFVFAFDKYAPIYSTDTFEDDIIKQLKEQNKFTFQIAKEIQNLQTTNLEE